MTKHLLALTVVLALAQVAPVQTRAQQEVPAANYLVPIEIAKPTGSGPFPPVLVQEERIE
jgi:hypothetical protein